MLPKARQAHGDLVAQLAANRALGIDRRIGAIADARIIAAIARLDRIELNDAGRGIAAEQGSLRPAQHLDPVELAELV